MAMAPKEKERDKAVFDLYRTGRIAAERGDDRAAFEAARELAKRGHVKAAKAIANTST